MLPLMVWTFISMGVTGALAVATHRPFIFPSLGPSALMIFGHPAQRTSSPRHVLIGHAIGAGCGYFAVWANGLLGVEYSPHITIHRVLAAAMALALTAAFTMLARSEHAPAGAPTLIVAFGLLPQLSDFLWLMLAVFVLVLLGLLARRAPFNRTAN
jgi:CBS-domain-containing membrane protein